GRSRAAGLLQMARILFAWELGAGLGHLNRMLPVARELRARGHAVFLAVQDLSKVQSVLREGDEFPWFQAPVWLPPLINRPPPASYAELLFFTGFLDTRGLLGLVRGWHALFAAIQPDLLVCDHAPVSLLTARSVPVRRATLGSGFFHPPAVAPLPVFRHWNPPEPGRVETSEQAVLATANQVLDVLRQPRLGALHELLDADRVLLTSWPELDHYPDRPAGPHVYTGPLTTVDAGREPAWPAGPGPRLFAYLKGAFKDIETVLDALGAGPARTLAWVSGLDADAAARHQGKYLHFAEGPVQLSQAMARCDGVVGHGTMGTLSAALLAGKPTLSLPMTAEQRLVAERVVALGMGSCLTTIEPAELAVSLRALTADKAQSEAARRFAAGLAPDCLDQSLRQICRELETLL
ncbi:MAG: hypothetical protein JJT85_06405, partial [Chromatiales bacterium]|nr:hypothetical protein [Chromatiales bacterium]